MARSQRQRHPWAVAEAAHCGAFAKKRRPFVPGMRRLPKLTKSGGVSAKLTRRKHSEHRASRDGGMRPSPSGIARTCFVGTRTATSMAREGTLTIRAGRFDRHQRVPVEGPVIPDGHVFIESELPLLGTQVVPSGHLMIHSLYI